MPRSRIFSRVLSGLIQCGNYWFVPKPHIYRPAQCGRLLPHHIENPESTASAKMKRRVQSPEDQRSVAPHKSSATFLVDQHVHLDSPAAASGAPIVMSFSSPFLALLNRADLVRPPPRKYLPRFIYITFIGVRKKQEHAKVLPAAVQAYIQHILQQRKR